MDIAAESDLSDGVVQGMRWRLSSPSPALA